jgi:hypothetical protein
MQAIVMGKKAEHFSAIKILSPVARLVAPTSIHDFSSKSWALRRQK